ncbi:MAG TPA: AMP-binding protein [Syntrophales bacterium]|nr:AMP-binding protein [Syntrophales bacterium]
MDLGLKKGAMVAFLMTNRSVVIETFFAIGKAGLVGLPRNYRLIAKEIIQMRKLTDAKIMIFKVHVPRSPRMCLNSFPE